MGAKVAGNRFDTVLTGVWGGDQAILTVGEAGASLKTGCAEGHIAGPLRIDRRGRISAQGTFQSFTPGPQRADEEPGAVARKLAVLLDRLWQSETEFRWA